MNITASKVADIMSRFKSIHSSREGGKRRFPFEGLCFGWLPWRSLDTLNVWILAFRRRMRPKFIFSRFNCSFSLNVT